MVRDGGHGRRVEHAREQLAWVRLHQPKLWTDPVFDDMVTSSPKRLAAYIAWWTSSEFALPAPDCSSGTYGKLTATSNPPYKEKRT